MGLGDGLGSGAIGFKNISVTGMMTDAANHPTIEPKILKTRLVRPVLPSRVSSKGIESFCKSQYGPAMKTAWKESWISKAVNVSAPRFKMNARTNGAVLTVILFSILWVDAAMGGSRDPGWASPWVTRPPLLTGAFGRDETVHDLVAQVTTSRERITRPSRRPGGRPQTGTSGALQGRQMQADRAGRRVPLLVLSYSNRMLASALGAYTLP